MESPKQKINVKTESNTFSTPSSSTSDEESAIVTPGSSDKSLEDSRPIVEEPHDNDVLCGRGGSINSHPGNERFRQLVETKKRVYLTARFKREKRLIANGILAEINSLKPPGRFLTKDPKTGNWHDIGGEKARDKTSQALRENAPSIRAEIEVEINQQRAEMQRAEEEEAALAASGHSQPYYQESWGYYAPHHRYGRYHAESPRYGNDERYEEDWHDQCSERERTSNHAHSSMVSKRDNARGQPYYSEKRDHSMHSSPEAERTAPIPSSSVSWMGARRSYEAEQSNPYHDQVTSSTTPPATKSLHYMHRSRSHEQVDHRDGRRMVHFEDDGHYHGNHYEHRKYQSGNEYYTHSSPTNCYRDRHYAGERRPHEPMSANAVTPESSVRKPVRRRDDEALQPHPATYDGDQGSSLLSQVANHIMGSWDTSMICTNSSIDGAGMTYSKNGPCAFFNHDPPHASLADAMEDEDGQEVELVEIMDCKEDGFEKSADHEDYDDIRVPPPDGNTMPPPPRRIEIDWPSKMLGCQSNWLPETFNPPSFFTQKSNPLSPSTSMDMDESAVGTEGISCAGSVGGASLCQVFSHEQMTDGDGLPSPSHGLNHQVLTQMPSWERSVRSKSPSTICSDSSVIDIPVTTLKSNGVGDPVTHPIVKSKSPDVKDEMKQ
mmetsp:Transcript_26365/g.38945  ORF Transcript_26365/g.38945 Transcript_26365/m.38945 type:complete len:662 (-) Transcript_26365:79-2064(-)|eukprot:CAMPEP_0194211610 /NCGR_PEP_ID=MMETSP0156-20130528/10691_1 /TAXON_ID=33649 /ORGANISM="Thalassionema nitzschioides, Strain L26-B" /LENGTH=661 /DNA_ID=CAMNT_0038939211 /DNA_START=115 /DNA_END=2100 /DNA_ORIENTATION=+